MTDADCLADHLRRQSETMAAQGFAPLFNREAKAYAAICLAWCLANGYRPVGRPTALLSDKYGR